MLKHRLQMRDEGWHLDLTGDRILGILAVVAAASLWGTLGLFAKIHYA
jgi:hypothetical protein